MSIFNKGQLDTSFEKTGDLVCLFARDKIKMNSTLTVGENQVAYVMVNDRITDEFLPGNYTLSIAMLPISTRALKLQKKLNNAKSIIKSITADLYIINKESVSFDEVSSFKFVVKDREFGRVETTLNYSCKLKVANPLLFLASLRKFVAVVSKGESVKLLKEFTQDILASICQKLNIQIRNTMTKKDEVEEKVFEKFVEKMQNLGIEIISFSMNKLNLKKSIARIFENVVDYTEFENASSINDKKEETNKIIFERVGLQGEGDRQVEATVINNNRAEKVSEFLNIDQFENEEVKPKREFRINLDGNSFLTSSGIENRNDSNLQQSIDTNRDNIFERRRDERNIISQDVADKTSNSDRKIDFGNAFSSRSFDSGRNVFERRMEDGLITSQTYTCKNCGKVLSLEDEFCSKCGTKVEK